MYPEEMVKPMQKLNLHRVQDLHSAEAVENIETRRTTL
jgi:hypothetical protein